MSEIKTEVNINVTDMDKFNEVVKECNKVIEHNNYLTDLIRRIRFYGAGGFKDEIDEVLKNQN